VLSDNILPGHGAIRRSRHTSELNQEAVDLMEAKAPLDKLE
jgi:hypothetical protein